MPVALRLCSALALYLGFVSEFIDELICVAGKLRSVAKYSVFRQYYC